MAKKSSEDPIVDIGGSINKGEEFFQKFKNVIVGGLTFVIIVVVGAWIKVQFFDNPASLEAVQQPWKAQYYFGVDSLDNAINGDQLNYGFAEIAEEYDGTPTGETAKYYLGLSFLHKGDYQTALDIFEKVSLDDDVFSTMVIGNMGDACLELGDVGRAKSYYQSAINDSKIDFTRCYWMFKLAQVHEFESNWTEAASLYTTIKEEYPESYEARQVDKFLARAENM